MPVLEVPGAKLHYRTTGDGPPLVLVHGSATDMTTWDGVVDELAREYQVVVYDRRGYGQPRHKPVRDHRIHAQDLTAILQQVARQPTTVVGWSSGGNVALAVAAKHRSFSRRWSSWRLPSTACGTPTGTCLGEDYGFRLPIDVVFDVIGVPEELKDDVEEIAGALFI